MGFLESLNNALDKFNKNEGLVRRILRKILSFMGKKSCICKLEEQIQDPSLKNKEPAELIFFLLESFASNTSKLSRDARLLFDIVVQEQFGNKLDYQQNSTEYRAVLFALHEKKCFTSEHIKALTQLSDPNEFIKTLSILHQVNSLNEYNFNALLSENSQQNISSITHLLQTLHRKKLLNSSNAQNIIDKLTQHLEMPGRVKDLVEALETHNTLDKDTFNTLIKYIQSDIEQKNYLAQHKEYVAGYEKQNDPNAQEKDELKHRINAEHFVFIKKIYGFFQAVHQLAENKLLNKNNFTFIAKKDPTKRAEILWTLQKHNLLTKETLTVLNHCIDPAPVADAMITLKKEGLLTAENWTLFQHDANPIQVVEAIFFLNNHKLLTAENRDLLQYAANQVEVTQAICFLGDYSLLTQENLALLQHAANPIQVAQAIYLLNHHKLLTAENRDLLQHAPNRVEVTQAICLLGDYLLLTKENLALLPYAADPIQVAKAICFLGDDQLLTEKNRDLLQHAANPIQVAEAICLLDHYYSPLSTEENWPLFQDAADLNLLAQTICLLNNYQLLTKENLALLQHAAHPIQVAQAICLLGDDLLLTQENRDLLQHAQHATNPIQVAQAIFFLNHNELLTAENRDLLQHAANPTQVAQAICFLGDYSLLTKENLALLQHATNPIQVAQAICLLGDDPLLTQENRDLLQDAANPIQVAEAIYLLNHHKLLTKENLALFQDAPNPTQVAQAICLLDNYPLSTEENWDPTQVAQAILFLGKKDLLQKENLNLFKKSRWVSSNETATMIQIFYENNILTKENLKNINDQGDYPGLRNAVGILTNNKILNQENFDLITTNTNPQETAQMLSLLAKNKISRDKFSFLTQEDDQGKTHFQTLKTLVKADMLNEKTLAILEIYASKFKKDAYYHCFELTQLLIQLGDRHAFPEKNMTEIKNINPNDLWLMIAIIKDLIQAKILNDSHCKEVITCSGLNLMAVKTKTTQLLEEGKLNNNNFTQLIKEIESNASRASMTPAGFFNSKHAANLPTDITENEESMAKVQTPSI